MCTGTRCFLRFVSFVCAVVSATLAIPEMSLAIPSVEQCDANPEMCARAFGGGRTQAPSQPANPPATPPQSGTVSVPPTPGWRYLSIGPSTFQIWPSVNPMLNPASTSMWHGGLRWSVGRNEVFAPVLFPEGAVLQELSCVVNVSPFNFQNQPVKFKVVANLEREVFGKEPGEDQSKGPVYRSLAQAEGPDAATGLLMMRGPAYPVHRVDNFGSVYWVRVTRYIQNIPIQDRSVIPPVDLRGCRIAYTLQ